MTTVIIPTTPTISLRPHMLLSFNPTILAEQIASSSIAMYARDFHTFSTSAGDHTTALDPAMLGCWRTALAADTALPPNTIKRLLKEAAA